MTPATRSTLKRYAWLLPLLPLLTWAASSTDARYVKTVEYHAARDSQEFRHTIDTLKQSNDYRNLMGVVLRVDSNVKAMRDRR